MFRLWPGCSDCGLRLWPRMLRLMLRRWPRMLRLWPGCSDCDLDAQIAAREWPSRAPNYLKMLTIPWLEDRRSWTDLSVYAMVLMCSDREVPVPIERNRRTGRFISACATVLMVRSDREVSIPIGRNWRNGRYIWACATVLVMCSDREVSRPADSDLRKPTELMISRSLCHGLNYVWTKRFRDR